MKYLPYAIIAGLLIVIFFLRECTPKPKPCPPPSIVTHTDTIEIPVDHEIPTPYPVHHYDTVEVPGNIDSDAVIKDYYSANIYDRKIVDDSTGTLILHDSVTRNRLTTSRLSGHMKQIEHTTTITNDITIPLRNRVYLGMQIGSDLNSIMIVPTATLLTKKDNTCYSISYDPFTKTYYAGIQFRIKLTKGR